MARKKEASWISPGRFNIFVRYLTNIFAAINRYKF